MTQTAHAEVVADGQPPRQLPAAHLKQRSAGRREERRELWLFLGPSQGARASGYLLCVFVCAFLCECVRVCVYLPVYVCMSGQKHAVSKNEAS